MSTAPLQLHSTQDSPYLTRSEAARIARCSERTIQRAQSAGQLHRFGRGLQALVSEPELRAWVEAGRMAPEPRRSRTQRRGVKAGSVADILEMERGAR